MVISHGKFALITGTVFACIAVIAGAFGAHAMRSTVSPEYLAVFETGVRYQMYHSLGLLGVGILQCHWPERVLRVSVWCFVLGILLFSGSLYVLVLGGAKWVGAITPLGGTSFIAGWILVAAAVLRQK